MQLTRVAPGMVAGSNADMQSAVVDVAVLLFQCVVWVSWNQKQGKHLPIDHLLVSYVSGPTCCLAWDDEEQ